MSEESSAESAQIDIGEYCRRVEAHLARVNQGHLIRIAGMSFELVRGWAIEGIPLSIVYRGIDQKAERHRAGRSKRPLRLEFCEADVRAVYDDWRRAVGVSAGAAANDDDPGPVIEERRRPSVAREIDRATARLVAAAGRLETPDALRDALAVVIERLATLREQLRHARGEAREGILAEVEAVDRMIADAARNAGDVPLAEVQAEAVRELGSFRTRMSAEAWQRSVDAAVDRLLRQRYGLPVL